MTWIIDEIRELINSSTDGTLLDFLLPYLNNANICILHHMLKLEQSSEIVTKLIEIGGRDLVMKVDNHGSTALHFACGRKNPSLEVISKLIEIGGRELVMKKDGDGCTALHAACDKNASFDVIYVDWTIHDVPVPNCINVSFISRETNPPVQSSCHICLFHFSHCKI